MAQQQRGRGRPSKLDPKLQKRLTDAIKAGNYLEIACRFAGIDYSTFRRWMQKGEQKAGEYRDFRDAVESAEVEAEVRIVAQWNQQMPESWQASRDFLARRHSERWGPKEQITHSGDPDRPLIPITEIVVERPPQPEEGDA